MIEIPERAWQAFFTLLIYGLPAVALWWVLGAADRRREREQARGFEVVQEERDDGDA